MWPDGKLSGASSGSRPRRIAELAGFGQAASADLRILMVEEDAQTASAPTTRSPARSSARC